MEKDEPRESFILTNLDGEHRGVYSSLQELSEGVTHLILEKPEESLIYELWYTNLSSDEITWKFAYVSACEEEQARRVALEGGISYFPSSIGINLITKKEEMP